MEGPPGAKENAACKRPCDGSLWTVFLPRKCARGRVHLGVGVAGRRPTPGGHRGPGAAAENRKKAAIDRPRAASPAGGARGRPAPLDRREAHAGDRPRGMHNSAPV